MSLNYYASSPTVVLPPQQPPNYLAEHARQPSPPRKFPVPPSINYQAATTNSAAGRKRSIQDVEPEDLPADCPTAVAPPPRPEPIMGPGMTLIYPDDPGFQVAAESQTGTWAEEKAQKEEIENATRPIAVSRKSARRSRESVPLLSAQQPSIVIDENGHTVNQLIGELGIGWKNMMSESTPATRAYTRVIENHFPLTDATIMLESEALSAYLVRARADGILKYWLFHDTLSWCQLLSDNLEGVVANLKAGAVPAVEGPRIIAQRNTPPGQPSTFDVEMSAASTQPIATQDDVMQL